MAYRLLGLTLLLAASVAACAADGSSDPFTGEGGRGGDVGIGGAGGSGAGGTGGTGGSIPSCTLSALCRSCPDEGFCDSNDDCGVGLVCIESGCDDLEGSSLKQCVFAGGGACTSDAMCVGERECVEVPGEGRRCVKTTPGCDSDFDCVPGFTCEDGACADRRVPCDLDGDCPMNHVCSNASGVSFCVRVHRDCVAEFDCAGIAPRCEDVDGDLSTECAGSFDGNDPLSDACTNAQCTDMVAPVCELSGSGSTAQCGRYGLCIDDDDCAAGFSCVALWADGRKECVEGGGACSSYLDCPVREVCASPRAGGAPSCQAGLQL